MKRYSILILIIAVALAFFTTTNIKTKVNKVDHSDMVAGPFESPQDVTRACIVCHEDQANEVLNSRHWLWLGSEFEVEGKGKVKFGKKVSFNNSYINVNSNESNCSSCHPGFGIIDAKFDFTNPENIDCLICHDNTGTYRKFKGDGSEVSTGVNLELVAQSVGLTTNSNCTNCHFEGGSSSAVMHGNLDPNLLGETKDVDVHLSVAKLNCTNCHKTEKHQISGASHGSIAQGVNHISCTDCHDNDKKTIHNNSTISKHLGAVACQSCHIPELAQNYVVLTNWDWSTAGTKEDVKFDDKHLSYSKTKGDLTWEKNVKPVLKWNNGKAKYYMLGDKITSKPVVLNSLNGTISDPDSKLTPFKLMKGKQIYDTENNYLIVPKLFGDGSFTTNFDWNKSSELGMKSVNLVYSGKYGFIETEMYLPINHSVPSKQQVLKCNNCHGKNGNIDWKSLGYPDDPLKKGGRVRNKLVK